MKDHLNCSFSVIILHLFYIWQQKVLIFSVKEARGKFLCRLALRYRHPKPQNLKTSKTQKAQSSKCNAQRITSSKIHVLLWSFEESFEGLQRTKNVCIFPPSRSLFKCSVLVHRKTEWRMTKRRGRCVNKPKPKKLTNKCTLLYTVQIHSLSVRECGK